MAEQKIGIVIEAKNRASKAFKDIEKNLDRAKKKTEAWNEKFKNTFDTLKASGAVLTGVGVSLGFMAKGWIDAAATAEEAQSKFNVVFGGIEKEMNEWSVEFANSMGRSNNEIKTFTSGLADVLKPMGATTEEAADMSKKITALALDVASFNDKQDADVIHSFTSALTGERESLKSLGIVISEIDVKNEAYRLGLVKQGDALTKTAKAQATMSLLFENTKDAQGDLARTGDSYTNSVKAMNSSMMNLKETLGTELLPIVTPVVQGFTNLVKGFTALSPRTKEIIAKVTLAAAAFALIGGPLLILIGFLPQIVAGFAMVGAAISLLMGPIGIIIIAISAVVAALIYVYKNSDTIQKQLILLWESFKEVIAEVWDSVTNIFTVSVDWLSTKLLELVTWFSETWDSISENMSLFWESFKETISEAWESIKSFFVEGAGSILEFIVNFLSGFFTVWSDGWKNVKSFFVGIWDGLVTYFEGILGKIMKVVDKIKSAFSLVKGKVTGVGESIGEGLFNLTHPAERAFGGMVGAGTPVLVGERGPEIVSFPQAGSVTPNNKLGGGITLNMPVTVSGNNFDSKSRIDEMVEVLTEKLTKNLELALAGIN